MTSHSCKHSLKLFGLNIVVLRCAVSAGRNGNLRWATVASSCQPASHVVRAVPRSSSNHIGLPHVVSANQSTHSQAPFALEIKRILPTFSCYLFCFILYYFIITFFSCMTSSLIVYFMSSNIIIIYLNAALRRNIIWRFLRDILIKNPCDL